MSTTNHPINLPATNRPIALLTDFGLGDWYVAALKGQILKTLPGGVIIDISHDVPAGQIASGSFVLECVLDSMPEGTVFCCVIDPGVGTARRALVGRIGPWFFSGPDNGLATPLLERAGDDFDLHDIQSPAFRSGLASDTFHGRDLFAPSAARLAAGAEPSEAGPAVADPIRLPVPAVETIPGGLVAQVMLVDHFGNLITNLRRVTWGADLKEGRFLLRAGHLRLGALNRAFGHVHESEALAYWGSAGTLEIAINRGSAAESTGLGVGDRINIDLI